MKEVNLNEIIATVISDNAEKIWKSICSFGKDVKEGIKIKCGTAFENYLCEAYKKYSYTKTILYKNNPVSLYDFYIDINLKYDKEIIKTDRILNIFEKSRYNIIAGSGGTGKSTLLKHLFLNAIKETHLIPIFIELRDFNTYEKGFENLIYDSMKNLHFDLEEKYFFQTLYSGSFVFLFDAFDEVIKEKMDRL